MARSSFDVRIVVEYPAKGGGTCETVPESRISMLAVGSECRATCGVRLNNIYTASRSTQR
jgi:hypothetical protein